MPLKDYTTGVPVHKTVGEIHTLLVKGGARDISTTYDETGLPVGLRFDIGTPYGLRSYMLPVRPAAVEAVLRRQRVEARFRTATHAQRVAWRIVKDWLEVQLAIIETDMVAFDQVMLPYMTNGERTVYEVYREQQLELTAGDE